MIVKLFVYLYLFLNLINKKLQSFKNRIDNYLIYKSFKEQGGKIGNGVKFGRNITISGFKNIIIGNNVHIGTGSFIRGEGGLVIEDNVIISRNAVIYSISHNYEGKLLPFDNTFLSNKVVIKKNSWIGMNVTISPGTTIGEGAIIGLGSRVFGKIPALAIVGTEKPKIIKYRNESHYNKLENDQLYAKEEGHPLNHKNE